VTTALTVCLCRVTSCICCSDKVAVFNSLLLMIKWQAKRLSLHWTTVYNSLSHYQLNVNDGLSPTVHKGVCFHVIHQYLLACLLTNTTNYSYKSQRRLNLACSNLFTNNSDNNDTDDPSRLVQHKYMSVWRNNDKRSARREWVSE